MIGGGCGRPHDHRPGSWSSAHSSSAHGFVQVGQRDVGSGEDPVLVRHAPVLGQPAVEGAEQEDDGARVVLEGFLVDHAQGREEPDPRQALRVHDAEAGVAVPVFGADRLGRAEELVRGAPVGIAAEVLHEGAGRRHRVEGGIGDGAADPAADGVVLAPSDVGPLDDPGSVGRVQVAGEGVERLVVVVVGVEDRGVRWCAWWCLPVSEWSGPPSRLGAGWGTRRRVLDARSDRRPNPGPLPISRRRPALEGDAAGRDRGNRPVAPG